MELLILFTADLVPYINSHSVLYSYIYDKRRVTEDPESQSDNLAMNNKQHPKIDIVHRVHWLKYLLSV